MSILGRAAVFVKSNLAFDVRQFPVVSPGPDDVLIRLTRTNICGSDRHLWNGHTELRQLGVNHPIILGHEMVGTVAQLGSARNTDALGRPLREGDRVSVAHHAGCGTCRPCVRQRSHQCASAFHTPLLDPSAAPHFVGGFADFYMAGAGQSVFAVPPGLTDVTASLANCSMSQALHVLEVGKFSAGDHIVVMGCGGLGLLTMAIARHRGAQQVIAVDVDPVRLDMARLLGATHVIDASKSSDAGVRVGVVRRLTEGDGADLVVEGAGVADILAEGVRMLGRGGRVVAVGNVNPRAYWRADASQLVLFNRSIKGVSQYPHRVLGAALDLLSVLAELYPLEAIISHTYSLGQLTDAMREPPEKLVRAAVLMDQTVSGQVHSSRTGPLPL